MSVKIWIHTSRGKRWLAHDEFLGFEYITPNEEEASRYMCDIGIDAVNRLVADSGSVYTVLAYGCVEQ